MPVLNENKSPSDNDENSSLSMKKTAYLKANLKKPSYTFYTARNFNWTYLHKHFTILYIYIYIYFKNQHLSFTYIQVLTSIRRKKPYRNSNAVSSLKEVSSTSLYFVVWQTAFILFWHFLERLRNKPSNIFVRWKLISYPHIILNSLFLRLKNLTHKQVLNRAKVTETKKYIYIYIYIWTLANIQTETKKKYLNTRQHSPFHCSVLSY